MPRSAPERNALKIRLVIALSVAWKAVAIALLLWYVGSTLGGG